MPAGRDVVVGEDGLGRCRWGAEPPEYRAYHDHEWGRPAVDDWRLFEKLCLEGFQAGLSWLTILRKRDAFRAAFMSFEPEAVAAFDEADVERLLADAGIVRHRGKIEATIANARAVRRLHEQGRTLAEIVWRHEPAPAPAPVAMSDLPASTPQSQALSTELKSEGFRFVGPTTVYAFVQSMGVVNDHLDRCWCREPVDAERRSLLRPWPRR